MQRLVSKNGMNTIKLHRRIYNLEYRILDFNHRIQGCCNLLPHLCKFFIRFNLLIGIPVSKNLCRYKFPAIFQGLARDSELTDLESDLCTNVVNRRDITGGIHRRNILRFPFLHIHGIWLRHRKNRRDIAGIHAVLFILEIKILNMLRYGFIPNEIGIPHI